MNQIVIPLHHGGGKFKNNTELRYCLRSIEKYFQGEYEISIVSRNPPAGFDNIKHIPDGGNGLKTALVKAAEVHPEGFYWWYDDSVLLQPQTPLDIKTTIASTRWAKPSTKWENSLENIRVRLEKEGHKPWDYSRPHGPYWFTKAMVDEGFADWPGMKGKFPWESWILSKINWPRRHGNYRQCYGSFNSPPKETDVLLNYCGGGGTTPELMKFLDEKFPTPSKHEGGADKSWRTPSSATATSKIEVHTIRFGSPWWLELCKPTLDRWCERHGHALTVWGAENINPYYPNPKYCEIDMLKQFLAGNSEWLLYVDSDIYVADDAPMGPPLVDGFSIRKDIPGGVPRDFNQWCVRHKLSTKGWTYRNAGVWLCDRMTAKQMIEVMTPPWWPGCQEQHQFNWWIYLAEQQGAKVNYLPAEWNAWAFESERGAFYHLAGKAKFRRLEQFRANGRIPRDMQKIINGEGIELVIARYQEDVNWSRSLGVRTTVYEKHDGGDLTNVGFEAQTFLHHFAVRYDSLEEITVCLQGNPFPHMEDSLSIALEKITRENFSFLPLAKHSKWQHRDGSPNHAGLGPANEKMWQELTGHCPPDLWYAWYGGQFVVHRDRIRAKPKEFWEHAASLVRTEEEACAVERLWPFLFL